VAVRRHLFATPKQPRLGLGFLQLAVAAVTMTIAVTIFATFLLVVVFVKVLRRGFVGG
jgi:hypothetical protein